MTLRPMLMSDSDFMLELKNDPQTRAYAILSHDEIKREDHIDWLQQNVQYFQVVEEHNHVPIRVAAIRFFDNEISVWVHEKYRGMGYAASAIKRVRKNLSTAKIVIGNISSIRAFIKADFRPVKLVDNKYYIFEFQAERWAQK